MKPLAPVLVALTLALAGCTSPEEAVTSAADAADAATGAAADATGAAGEAAANATADAAPATKEVVTPLATEGTTDQGVCAFTIAGGNCVGNDSDGSEVALEAPGALTRVTAIVEWTPTTPAHADLQVYLVEITSDGGLNFTGEAVEGPSPLSLDWDLTPHAGKSMHLLVTNMRGSEIPVGFVGAEAEQSYTLTGEIRSQAAA